MRPVPATGELLPVVGLGTWQAFDVRASEYASRGHVLAEFVRLGGRVVDSSPMYGHAEEAVGHIARNERLSGQLFLATKVWTTGRAAGLRQIEQSFRLLGTDRLDLLQVHNLVDAATHLATLRELKAAGRVRYIGVTHYAASAHRAVADILEREPVDFVQINYSVAEREAEQRILPLAQERGIAVLINRPFAEGAALRTLKNRPLPVWAGEIGCESWPQLLLKFVVAHPAVTCVIPATSNLGHLRDNMRALLAPLPDSRLRDRIAAAATHPD